MPGAGPNARARRRGELRRLAFKQRSATGGNLSAQLASAIGRLAATRPSRCGVSTTSAKIARRLADPRGLPDAEAEKLVGEGKVVLLVTCNIHSTEIGASQLAMEWAHALATAQDPETSRRLEQVVVLLVVCLLMTCELRCVLLRMRMMRPLQQWLSGRWRRRWPSSQLSRHLRS